MKIKQSFYCVLLLSIVSTPAWSQKFGLVPDSLKKITDELPVKLGAQWPGKIFKMKFGTYAVTDSKNGWTTTTSKGHLFDRRVSSETHQKFSFTFTDGSQKTTANVTQKVEQEILREQTLFSVSTGKSDFTINRAEELLLAENSLNAVISLVGDTTEVWGFMMRTVVDRDYDQNFIARLTNGTQSFYLIPITSKEKNIPALGYKLINENKQAIAALQFFGGGMLGTNKSIIWLPKDYDPKLKLIIATTLTAVLQTKVGSTSFNGTIGGN